MSEAEPCRMGRFPHAALIGVFVCVREKKQSKQKDAETEKKCRLYSRDFGLAEM